MTEKQRKYNREYKQKNLKRIRERDRKYQRLRRKLNVGLKAKEYHIYYWKNPTRARAQQKFNYHLRRGHLVKKPCEVCGDLKTQGHHPDYNKPLEVIWLCASCHKREHLKAGRHY